MVAANSAIADAAYGPPPPPVPVPGGYFQVVTSQTIGTAGGTIGPLSAGHLEATLVIPAGAFSIPLQVTITEPDVAAIGNGGRRGRLAVGGVGVVIQLNASLYRGFFRRPLILTLSSPQLAPDDLVMVWNGTRFVPMPGSTVHHHSVTIRILSEAFQYFAILKPARSTGISTATARYQANEMIFAGLFPRPPGAPMPGLGVLAPA